MVNTFDDMVVIVEHWFYKNTDQNRKEFLETPKEKLIMYHKSLGKSIRNEFKLWETEWKPSIRDGIDYSPDHPDQVSMRVIEEVWKRLKNS